MNGSRIFQIFYVSVLTNKVCMDVITCSIYAFKISNNSNNYLGIIRLVCSSIPTVSTCYISF